jgi:Meiotically up-regulated gene 113
MTTREEILSEIRRLAAENGGIPVGRERFTKVTGITPTYWGGKYWARWNDAVAEAGLRPNALQEKVLSDDELLEKVARLVIELGHFPTDSERRLKRRSDRTFPSAGVIDARFGGRNNLLKAVVALTSDDPHYEKVLEICQPLLVPSQSHTSSEDASAPGYVYLIKSGKHFKIGCTRDVLRRHGEIQLVLAEKVEPVHTIETDDPYGVENYWHRRFEDRRLEGEWFALTAADVRAFKKWKRIY